MKEEVEICIVGSGFSGLGMAINLLKEGERDFVVLERGDDVGGTWHFNTYPGCGCDVPSHLYSFSFAPNPEWSQTYSLQPEIRTYLQKVADDFGVRPYVETSTTMTAANWREDEQRWVVETDRGTLRAKVLVTGMGPLAEPRLPDIDGLDSFEGTVMHSARWDDSVELEGKRVASIGTGASAIQYVPEVRKWASKLHVFQRTAPWILPHTNREISGWEKRLYKLFPPLQRLNRAGIYAARESVVVGLVKRPRAIKLLEQVARRHINSSVKDPELREKVTPDYTIGCKRMLPSNKWYPALSTDNVELVTAGVREVKPNAIVDEDGVEREVDVILLGTGFQVADMPLGKLVRGPLGRDDGRRLGRQPPRAAGVDDARLSQHVHAARPEHRAGAQLDGLHDRVAGRLRDGRAARDARPRRGHRRGAARGGRGVQRRGRPSPRGDGVDQRLLQLVPGRHRPQRDAVAGLDVPVPAPDVVVQPRALPAGVVKRVLLTGAASGIGEATAAELRRQGVQVAGLDLDEGEGIIACDVTDQDSVDRAVAEATERLGGLDVVVNCAGIGIPQSAGLRPDEGAQAVIDVNLMGPWRVTAAALRRRCWRAGAA